MRVRGIQDGVQHGGFFVRRDTIHQTLYFKTYFPALIPPPIYPPVSNMAVYMGSGVWSPGVFRSRADSLGDHRLCSDPVGSFLSLVCPCQVVFYLFIGKLSFTLLRARFCCYYESNSTSCCRIDQYCPLYRIRVHHVR